MSTYLPRVQALRFAAAAMVLFGHVQHKLPQVPGLDLSQHEALANATFFAGGVDIFFVLSGFIMVTITARDFGRAGAPAEFLLRRWARIVPSYWLFTSAMLVSMLLLSDYVQHDRMSAAHTLASYFFIPALNGYGEMYPALILGWTLNFEMFFYIVFAAMLGFRRQRGWLLIGAVVGAFGLAGLFAAPAAPPLAFWCNPIVFEFLFGMVLGHVHNTGLRWPRALGALVGLAGFGLLYGGATLSTPSPFWPARFVFMGLPALAICAAAVLTQQAAYTGRLQRLLLLAGDASYALYLSHPFVLSALALLWLRVGAGEPLVFMLVAVLACIGFAIAFHRCLEKPITLALNKRIERRPLHTHAPLGT
jgi:exopolysaccharide production protein ExoZ